MGVRAVTRDRPCPVCSGNHKCSISEDGLILCGRRTGDVDGYKCFGPTKNSQWSAYRAKTDNRSERVTKTKPPVQDTTDWQAVAKRYAFPPGANSLDVAVNLPPGATGRLPLVGFNPVDVNGACWTVPMVNGAERIVGISRRYRDGAKKSMGSNGLFVPAGWRDTPGPLFVVEGASDTAAMTAAGLCAVGRPSDRGGVEMLYALITDDERPVIVVGERDESEAGHWPGLSACIDVAARLKKMFRLNRSVKWSIVPEGYKDARDYLTSFDPEVPWEKRGVVFASILQSDAVFVDDERVMLGRAVVQMQDAVTRMNGLIDLLQTR